jgi:hypothetical protein
MQMDDDGKEFVIAYASRSNNNAEAQYSSYEGDRVVTRPDVHGRVRRTSGRVRRSHGRPPWRPSAGGRGRPTEADGCPVRRGPSAITVHRKPSTGSRPPPLSIWGRPPAPSALYDSNFSFLHYVFVSLIAVT